MPGELEVAGVGKGRRNLEQEMTTTKDSKKLVQARIDHAKAIGDYQAAWNANDTTAIAVTWGAVKETRKIVKHLVKGTGKKK